eukprot:91292_1
MYPQLLCIIHTIITSNSKWTEISTPSLRYADSSMAVGSYHNTASKPSIFILGGYELEYQLTEYSIPDNAFISHSNLPSKTWGYGRPYYTQIDHILYSIYLTGSELNTYNMATNTYTTQWTPIPIDVDYYGCLASNNDHLFVVGGFGSPTNGPSSGHFNVVQVLVLGTMQWLDSVPSTQVTRIESCCIAEPLTDSLYVLGGSGHNTIEKIKITDITQEEWYVIPDRLSVSSKARTSTWFHDMIFVIGGYDPSNGHRREVDIIDPLTDSVSVGEPVPYGVFSASVTVFNDTLYLFGGGISGCCTETNKWLIYDYEYYEPPTSNPITQTPTADPSTQSPSFDPSTHPVTQTPTVDPSTQTPTGHPIVYTIAETTDETQFIVSRTTNAEAVSDAVAIQRIDSKLLIVIVIIVVILGLCAVLYYLKMFPGLNVTKELEQEIEMNSNKQDVVTQGGFMDVEQPGGNGDVEQSEGDENKNRKSVSVQLHQSEGRNAGQDAGNTQGEGECATDRNNQHTNNGEGIHNDTAHDYDV